MEPEIAGMIKICPKAYNNSADRSIKWKVAVLVA